MGAGAKWVRQGCVGRSVAQTRAEKRLLVADDRPDVVPAGVPAICSNRVPCFQRGVSFQRSLIVSEALTFLWIIRSRLVREAPYIRVFCGDLSGLAGRDGCERRAIRASVKRNCRRLSLAELSVRFDLLLSRPLCPSLRARFKAPFDSSETDRRFSSTAKCRFLESALEFNHFETQ